MSSLVANEDTMEVKTVLVGGQGGDGGGKAEPAVPWYKKPRNQVKVGIIVLLLSAIIVSVAVFRVQDRFEDWLEWFEKNPVAGGFIFIAIYWVATVLLLPASLLSLGAGAVFGLGVGILVVEIGAILGQTSAFIVGRYLLREWVEGLIFKYPTFVAVDGATLTEGWKIVALLRLSPAIPYNVLNYALSLTAVSFVPYFIASALGIIPGVVLFVYVGSLARNLAEITSGEQNIDGGTQLAILIVSGVMIILTVVFITVAAKRVVKKKLAEAEARSGGLVETEAAENV